MYTNTMYCNTTLQHNVLQHYTPTTLLIIQQGSVLRPAKLWCDTESSAEAEELSAQLGYTLVRLTAASKQAHIPWAPSLLALQMQGFGLGLGIGLAPNTRADQSPCALKTQTNIIFMLRHITRTHIHVHPYAHMYTHTYVHTHTCTLVHTYVHAHTHIRCPT
jgi:hypothetical protein